MFSIHFIFFVEMKALDSFSEIFELLFSGINELLAVFGLSDCSFSQDRISSSVNIFIPVVPG